MSTRKDDLRTSIYISRVKNPRLVEIMSHLPGNKRSAFVREALEHYTQEIEITVTPEPSEVATKSGDTGGPPVDVRSAVDAPDPSRAPEFKIRDLLNTILKTREIERNVA